MAKYSGTAFLSMVGRLVGIEFLTIVAYHGNRLLREIHLEEWFEQGTLGYLILGTLHEKGI